MDITLSLKQQIELYSKLKHEFENMSYLTFYNSYKQEGLELRDIPLTIAINKAFDIGLKQAREVAKYHLLTYK